VACAGIDEVVKVTYDLMAVSYTFDTVTSPATVAWTAPYKGLFGGVTIGGGAYVCQSWSVSLHNNYVWRSSLDYSGTSGLRIPEGLSWGSEQVTARFVCGLPLYIDLMADWPALPISANFRIGNEFTARTILAQQLFIKQRPTRLVRSGDKVLWDLECESRMDSLYSAQTAAWQCSLAA
jgi:hypothetical protein